MEVIMIIGIDINIGLLRKIEDYCSKREISLCEFFELASEKFFNEIENKLLEGKMKLLINLSNHNSQSWSEKQKSGWDKIIDVQFPTIDPNVSINDVSKIVQDYFVKVNDIISKLDSEYDVYLNLQGEFSFCYLFLLYYYPCFKFVIPTTERKVIEVKDGDKVVKQSVFEFVQWREIVI